MADDEVRSTDKMRASSQRDKPERSSLSKSSDRTAQASQRSLPSMGSPDDSIPSTPSSLQTPQSQRPKVAIPRLRRHTDDPLAPPSSSSAENKHRVSHACEPCRQRKTKCSGERPVCKHCEDFKITCVYADGKRDRTKREYNTMAAQVADYKRVLEDLHDRVGEADQHLIQKMLQKDVVAEGHEGSVNQPVSPMNLPPDQSGPSKFLTEHIATGRTGSTDSVDCINEDFNRSDISRSTGFMGKVSEVTWMGKLLQRTSESGDDNEKIIPQMSFGFGLDMLHEDEGKKNKEKRVLSDSSYRCDDVPFVVLDNVQAYDLPPRATADSLFTCYMETVHPMFPIIGKTIFLKQYQAFYNNPTINTGANWLSILNFIFAIGARYSRLIRAEWSGAVDEPDVYFSRAWLLGLDADSIWTQAELQRIQITGLASFYFMAMHQINRAFTMSGIAVRQAVTLGLHLRNEDPNLTDFAKEIRYQVWWAIASIERALIIMVGRPTCITTTDCSAPLPMPLEEEMYMSMNQSYDAAAVRQARRLSADDSFRDMSKSTSPSVSSKASTWSQRESSSSLLERSTISPNNGLFFLYITKLKILDHDILKQLYRPSVVTQSWASVQGIMLRLQERLDRWRSGLPAVFDFTRIQRDQAFNRQRMCLGVMYYSSVIITKRPCLCKIEEKIPNESKKAKDIDRASAVECVYAAQSLVDLLPDEIDLARMYEFSPWWNMVHHLMQAVTALMLEISLNAVHCPDSADVLFLAAQKAIAWLQSMSLDDLAAARAWRLSSEALGRVAPRIGRRIDERLTRSVQPGEDVSMQDLLMSSANYDAASSAYGPMTLDEAGFANLQGQASWEPLMFTSYDNYLLGSDMSNVQVPSQHPNQWN